MIQLLRGTKSQLDSYQTVIAEGQPVFEKDTGQLKIGNGSSIYSALPYVGASSGGSFPSATVRTSSIDSSKKEGYIDFTEDLRLCFGVWRYSNSENYYFWNCDTDNGGLDETFGKSRNSTAIGMNEIYGGKGIVLYGTTVSNDNDVLVYPAQVDNNYATKFLRLMVYLKEGVQPDPSQQPLALTLNYQILCYSGS